MKLTDKTRGLAAWACTLLACTAGYAQTGPSGCGSLENSYGPFDYRADTGNKLRIVEQYHFTPNIQSLVSGNSASVGAELDYTLKASPNHHRALMAMIRLGEKLKSPQPVGAQYSVECYFERALRFKPDDSTARMIYATFLSRNGRLADATLQLEAATKTAGDNPFTHYNIGRIYFDIRNYDRSLEQAHKAYGLGFSQPTLRDQLKSVGRWTEPQASPPQGPEQTTSVEKPTD
jgi:tetratricopeptide (TPR) repeat protein